MQTILVKNYGQSALNFVFGSNYSVNTCIECNLFLVCVARKIEGKDLQNCNQLRKQTITKLFISDFKIKLLWALRPKLPL